jgi:hypothetical protein
MCKDTEVISPLYANIYRLHILGTHKETDVGKQLIRFANNQSAKVLKVLEQWERIIKKINNLSEKRNQTALLRRKYDELSGEEKTT